MKNVFFTGILFMLLLPLSVTALDIQSTDTNLLITGKFDPCTVETEKRGESQFCSLSIDGYASTGEPGKASLPVFSQLFALPPSGSYMLSDFSFTYDEQVIDEKIRPFGWEDDLTLDEDFYKQDEWYPNEIVTIGSPVIMRGYRFCQISIAAVQYNPAQNMIRTLKDIKAEFELDTSNDENPLTDTKNRSSYSFSKIASEHIYGMSKDGINDNGSYLIITPDACAYSLELLAEWKRKLGHEVTITLLSEIGASPDNYDIKDYIQNAYLSWDVPPEFVILVGDVTGNFIMPSFYVDGYLTPYDVSDHPYTLLDGTDYFPDIYIGRISIQSLMNLNTIITKIITYESTYIAGNWYDEALMISCIDPEYGMFTHYITKLNIGTKLYYDGFNQVDFFTYPMNVGIPQLISMIDDGYTLINFRGFGSPLYWCNSYGYHFLNSSDLPSLNNGFMLPMLTSMTCGGGDFAFTEADQCFGELWMAEGTPSNPRGSIGFIGPSEWDTKTPWNNCNDMGIYQGITQEDLFRCGEMMLRGKMELYNNYPHNHAWGGSLDSDQFYFYVYNLLGDPGLQVWTDEPKDITVITEDEISDMQNYLVVEIDVDDEKSDFMVSLTKDGALITKGMTDENGSVTLFADFLVDSYQVTASKYEFLPEVVNISVNAESQLDVTEVTFIDDPISGTDAEYSVTLDNPNLINAEDIEIMISTDEEAVTVITDSAYVQNIPVGASHTFENLLLSINEKWAAGKTANVDVNISSNFGDQSYIIPVEIVSPELVLMDFLVQNADTCLIQNQQDNVIIKLTNTGDVQTGYISATLLCTNGKADVIQDVSFYNSIAVGETGSNLVYFSVLPDEVITGEIAQFELEITKNDSIVQTLQFSIPIGLIEETSPTFSNYGYYAIESSDTGFFNAPVYDWVELNPAMGGQGIPVWGDYTSVDGYTKILNLPFGFTYFGNFYETISISSSGWLSMGEEIIYHRNRTIPSGCGPSAMIAPFWDNLQNGIIFSWFDQDEHRYIIEWQAFENFYDPSVKETFEVILYDPEYYPTPTGDGEILFQYQTISNVDQDENYATVGIENFPQTDGVLMTYANIYAPTAHTLQNETAILFTIKEGPDIPLLEIAPQQLEFTIPQDTTETAYLTLTNSSTQELSYWIESSHFSRDEAKEGGKSIENDFILCTTASYVPVIPIQILCYLYHNSPDDEPVYGVRLDFSDGVFVNTADNVASLNYNGETGMGASVTWGFGNGTPVYISGVHGFQINVTIDPSITGPIEVGWYLEGDGSGTAPHSKEGTFTLQPSTNSYLWMDYPDGGETLVYSTIDTIRWFTYGSIDNVSVYLSRDNCNTWETLAENIPNTNELAYTVAGVLSDNCRIKVQNTNGSQNDMSDNTFSINIFDITHPENGEVLEYNTLDTLIWYYTGIYQNVILQFSPNNGYTWETINNEMPNAGTYEYTVPGPPSRWCAFRIISPDYTTSNRTLGVFTIVDTPIGWLQVGASSGTLEPGGSALIPIHVNTTELEAGYYEAYVCVTSQIGQKINIPIMLEVSYGNDDEPQEDVANTTIYPNPFISSATISYYKTKNSQDHVEIIIYNIKGQLIREIEDIHSQQGVNEVVWNGKDRYGKSVSSGLYYYQIKVGNEIIGTNKCLLMRE
ncbi:MAG: T9SS type A sorting domain-containing protein [Candidatus Cloacimonetes bacterium]|nr:T9SS type A sorting domain-containing protein [Candidatus Cloacimonadota bacterium]